MGCGCNQSKPGSWEVVNADGTVRPVTYATSSLAQSALVASGGGGYVRQKQGQPA